MNNLSHCLSIYYALIFSRNMSTYSRVPSFANWCATPFPGMFLYVCTYIRLNLGRPLIGWQIKVLIQLITALHGNFVGEYCYEKLLYINVLLSPHISLNFQVLWIRHDFSIDLSGILSCHCENSKPIHAYSYSSFLFNTHIFIISSL